MSDGEHAMGRRYLRDQLGAAGDAITDEQLNAALAEARAVARAAVTPGAARMLGGPWWIALQTLLEGIEGPS